MKLPGFVGGSNVLSSTLMDMELSVNVLPEVKTGGFTKNDQGWLPDRPGLDFLFSVGTSGVECLFEINGRAFGIAGTVFFEFFDDDTYLVRGTVAHDGIDLATMCSGGTASDSIFIIAGSTGYGFTLSTNTLTQIVDADFPANPVMCEFFAGYFLVLLRNSRQIQWSALEDCTTWDALDVFQTSWTGDNVSFIKRSGTHIWCIGDRCSEVLYATGDLTVFAPAQESLIEHGAVARFSGQRSPNGILCLDQDERGVGQVIEFRGLTPDRVSTYAIDLEQQHQRGVLNAANAYLVQFNGHVWYVLNNASGTFDKTPVLDLTEGQWHHWAHWNSTSAVWFPFVGQCHVSAFERHYIGDRRTGAIYELLPDQLSDELADAA